MTRTPAAEDPWKTARLRLSAINAIRSVQLGGETLSDVILRLVEEHIAAVRAAGPWASTGAPHATEAVQAAPRREPQPEAPKDAGVQGPVVKAECNACDSQREGCDDGPSCECVCHAKGAGP